MQNAVIFFFCKQMCVSLFCMNCKQTTLKQKVNILISPISKRKSWQSLKDPPWNPQFGAGSSLLPPRGKYLNEIQVFVANKTRNKKSYGTWPKTSHKIKIHFMCSKFLFRDRQIPHIASTFLLLLAIWIFFKFALYRYHIVFQNI